MFKELLPKLGVSYLNGKWKAGNQPNTGNLAKARWSKGITIIVLLQRLKSILT